MAADTIRFIVTVAIVVYKGLIPVVGRMLTLNVILSVFTDMNYGEEILMTGAYQYQRLRTVLIFNSLMQLGM